MKVLVVCSGNFTGFSFEKHQSFIYDQVNAIAKSDKNITLDTFFIRGKGIRGYLANLNLLKKKIKEQQPDLIHAHGGHIGLLCNLQRRVPVITTFHGSDINYSKNRALSALAAFLSTDVIFVSEMLRKKASYKSKRSYVIPCGIDLDVFYPIEDETDKQKNYILFASSFDNYVKNFPLTQKAVELSGVNIDILEIKNKSRSEVNVLLNQSSLLLLTSYSEGSPQIIKEAMATNCPIVATDVGDIRDVVGDTEGCFVSSADPLEIAENIKLAHEFSKTKGRTKGREKIRQLDNKIIADRIIEIYKKAKG